jgi:hypothetical protein
VKAVDSHGDGLEPLFDVVALVGIEYGRSDTGGCNSFTHQSLLSADTDSFRLDSQFEFSRTYSHQYEHLPQHAGVEQ